MNSNNDQQMVLFIAAAVIVVAALAHRARRGFNAGAFGSAKWASDAVLRAAGMLGNIGLILGRTMGGEIIRIPTYCHTLLVGAPSSGKTVSIIIPNLLAYTRGSVVVFDCKGDLYETCAVRRVARGERIVRLAPFGYGSDRFNPLDTIHPDSPMLVDSARAIAESLVVRLGTEHDSHWNDKAVQVICAILVLVLMKFNDKDRNLNSVSEIASDPDLLFAAADKLRQLGGIPARLGNQLKALFDKNQAGILSKEGAGVMSTVARHLAFLDSELVARTMDRTTFDPAALLKPGTTLFLNIPPEMLEAMKGLLRLWIASLVRMIGIAGDERAGEVLFLLDEASALGSLSALEEAMVRGRSAGVRLLLAYQSDAQVKSAFKDKPSLIYDNCTTQIYLGASSIETAERISKSLGEFTQVLESVGHNESRSWNTNEYLSSNQGQQISRGTNTNYSVTGRPLLRPEEVLQLNENFLIAFHRGVPPIMARRIKWFRDPSFQRGAARAGNAAIWLFTLVAIALLVLAFSGRLK